jgi:hypothetical protein
MKQFSRTYNIDEKWVKRFYLDNVEYVTFDEANQALIEKVSRELALQYAQQTAPRRMHAGVH